MLDRGRRFNGDKIHAAAPDICLSSFAEPEPARPHCRYEKIERAGFNRILRVARTLADLDHRDIPAAENVATAIRWRDIAF